MVKKKIECSFITLFDSNYLPVGFSMIESLLTFYPRAKIHVICLDTKVHDECLKSFPGVKPIMISEVEGYYPDLLKAKSNRSRIEYFYTLSSVSINYLMDSGIDSDYVTYLDSDLFFYSSPLVIFDELVDNTASVGIISHKFNLATRGNLKYGKYNVGWVTFKIDDDGVACAKHWMAQCIDWCYQKIEHDRYADQKYLNFWPTHFKGVHEIKNIGANVAVWNMKQFAISVDKANRVTYLGEPLIFYHFAGLRNPESGIFDSNLSAGLIFTTAKIKELVYLPYVNTLTRFSIGQDIMSKPDTHVKGFLKYFRETVLKFRKLIFRDIFYV